MSQKLVREVMSMLGCKFQVAKRVVHLAAKLGGVDNSRIVRGLTRDGRAPLTQTWALGIVEQARIRVEAADEGES